MRSLLILGIFIIYLSLYNYEHNIKYCSLLKEHTQLRLTQWELYKSTLPKYRWNTNVKSIYVTQYDKTRQLYLKECLGEN